MSNQALHLPGDAILDGHFRSLWHGPRLYFKQMLKDAAPYRPTWTEEQLRAYALFCSIDAESLRPPETIKRGIAQRVARH